ncbi:MAG: hypothetical protein MJZ66_02770 [Bacteroidales bacterium]|nr:hypothetical protein [Bacteroidales bacterium]
MRTQPRQTLLDIALAACGSPEDAVQLAILHGLSLSQELTPGMDITPPRVSNGKVTAFFAITPQPATAITATPDSQPETFGGINYMGIEIDFKVS